MAANWHEVRSERGDPDQGQIQAMCAMFQQTWSRKERRRRQSGIDMNPAQWSVKQYLVHHAESGRWVGGTCHMVQVWRCVDGR